jgi:hypothetical protein
MVRVMAFTATTASVECAGWASVGDRAWGREP